MGVSPEPGERAPDQRWQLVSRDGCHLCDEMAALLDAAGLSYGVRDVDREPELAERYSDVVPVLLRDGRPVAKLRVSAGRLRRLIRRRR